MKHRLFYTLGPIVLVMVTLTISHAQQTAPKPGKAPAKTIQAMTAEQLRKTITPFLPANYDHGWTALYGVSNASYDILTGELWATSINDGKNSEVLAGFYTSGVQNIGNTSWNNVTVTATIQVLSIALSGGSCIYFCVCGVPSNAPTFPPSEVYINNLGQYTVTSQPFNMLPGVIYQGCAYIITLPRRNNGVSAHAKIVSININLP